MLKKLTITSLVAASFTGAIAQEAPYPDTIIVLDVSNSMWGQIGGVAKILIARDVISDLVTGLEVDIDPAGFKTAVNNLPPKAARHRAW